MRIPTLTYSAERHAGRVWRYAHYKRDGHSLNLIRSSADGRCFGFTSRPKDIFNQLPKHVQQAVREFPLGTSVLGELWLPGATASAIKTALIDSNPALRFSMFALLGYDTFQRYALDRLPLEQCRELGTQLGLDFIDWRVPAARPLDMLQQLPADCEGYVLKNGNMVDWCKLKRKQTIDLIVRGFTPGDGKYSQQIGAVCCTTFEGHHVANVSGMTDQQRQYFTEHGEQLIGTVVEVEYQGVGSQGRLRHPVFVRMRDDKAAENCNAAQDDDLLAFWQGSQKNLFN